MTAVADGAKPAVAAPSNANDPKPSGPKVSAANLPDDPLWYKDAVIYEVRARSYFDSDDDGIGDIRGLTQKLDYLVDLGITAIWLLPTYPSPGRDDGYDIADYETIHPDVGTLEDFDELIAEAHKRGLRVITELVLNHTSDQHKWFQRSRRAPAGSPERDFYVWNDTPEKYVDARIIFRDFEPSNWTWDPVAKAYFWHRFFAHQPDLNYKNPAVHEAMLAVVDFWLDRGVDGLRLDAVPYLYEEEGTSCENLPDTHAFLKKLRARIDSKFKNRMLLAEANQWPEDAVSYFGNGDECHMNFHFPLMPRLFIAITMEDRFPIIDILGQTPAVHESCQWAMFLRNHDELTLEVVTDDERDTMYRAYAREGRMRLNLGIRRRLAPLVENDRRRMQLLNGLLFSMPGTPVVYYGDEIGMGDNVYLGDRDGVRTPMQWSADRNAGFSRANPQKLVLPIVIDPVYHYEAIHVDGQQQNPQSLLWWMKRLIALRKSSTAFGRGTMEFLHPNNPHVLAFIRKFEGDTILVVANLARHPQYVELDLSAHADMIPVELMGGTKFPAIGAAPYLLTLGGYDFYWFRLDNPKAQVTERQSILAPPPLVVGTLEALLFGKNQAALADGLVALLAERRWLGGTVSRRNLLDVVTVDAAAPLYLAILRLEYDQRDSEMFALPLTLRPKTAAAPGAPTPADVVMELWQPMPDGTSQPVSIVDASATPAITRLAAAIAERRALRGMRGRTTATVETPLAEVSGDPHVLAAHRGGATIALGHSAVLRVAYLVEEGGSAALEIARKLKKAHVSGHFPTPELLGALEYRVGPADSFAVATTETFVRNEGTARAHAERDIARAYEWILAHPHGTPPPTTPTDPLMTLAFAEPEPDQKEIVGAYREWAKCLGVRVATLHLALADADDPAFAPHAYLPMELRAKYQSARNLVGRAMGLLRRALPTLPAPVAANAESLLGVEALLLSRFEPLRSRKIDAMQIRVHGDLTLDAVLFTGKDFVIEGVGETHGRARPSTRQKASAFRDVASMVRSFHHVAARSLMSLRPEDQTRAEPWGWVWQRWSAAAFVRAYLDATASAPFVSRSVETTSLLLETAILEKSLEELCDALTASPELAWIPIQALLRKLAIFAPPLSHSIPPPRPR